LRAKLAYLEKLEAASSDAWDGKVSLLLERRENAPDYVAEHPHMEPPPVARAADVGARFLQPEIVTAKGAPAKSVSEALGRAAQIIADTGHAGVQFHVFWNEPPQALLAQMQSLESRGSRPPSRRSRQREACLSRFSLLGHGGRKRRRVVGTARRVHSVVFVAQ
jgi:hypothetical protein